MSERTMKLYVRFFYASFASFSFGIATQQIMMSLLIILGTGLTVAGYQRFASAYSGIQSAGIFLGIMLALVITHQFLTDFQDQARFHWAFVVLWSVSIPLVRQINWSTLHRILVIVSVPGLLFSMYTLLEPAEFMWALKINSFHMYPRAYGFVSNPITNAEGLVVIAGWTLARLPHIQGKRERNWLVAHLVAIALIIVFSRVRAGIVGLILVFAIHAMLIHKHRAKLLTGALGILLIFVLTIPIFGFNKASIDERLALTQHSLRIFQDHPLIGIGCDQFDKYPGEGIPPDSHPHNTLLAIATELGLFGLLAFLWLMFTIARRLVLLVMQYRWIKDDLNWVTLAIANAFVLFLVFGLTDYNFGDTELLIFHGFHWALMFRIPLQHETLETAD